MLGEVREVFDGIKCRINGLADVLVHRVDRLLFGCYLLWSNFPVCGKQMVKYGTDVEGVLSSSSIE
jgi:hypothetical protein